MNPENAPNQAPVPTPGIGMAPQAPPQMPAQQPQEQPPAPAPTAPDQTPTAPQPTPQEQPTEEPQQQPQPQQQATEPVKQLTYEEYLEQATGQLPKAPEFPKATEVNQDDPESLNKFFETFGQAIEQRAERRMQEQAVIQRAEARAWTEVFDKYPEVEKNQNLRDTIHNIRVGAYHRGETLSPIQVADALVGTLHTEYKRGINDQQVQTRVQQSQPLNGGGQPPATPSVNYEALQQPGMAGEQAAIAQLEAMIAAGRL